MKVDEIYPQNCRSNVSLPIIYKRARESLTLLYRHVKMFVVNRMTMKGDEHQMPKECQLGGDTTNDCDGCVYSGDYHYDEEVDACVRRAPIIVEKVRLFSPSAFIMKGDDVMTDSEQALLDIHKHMGKVPYDALVLWATHLVDGVDSTLKMHEDNYLTIYDKDGYVNRALIDHLELEFIKAMAPNAYGSAFNRFYADIREQLLEMHSS